jgi:hypothetical protein
VALFKRSSLLIYGANPRFCLSDLFFNFRNLNIEFIEGDGLEKTGNWNAALPRMSEHSVVYFKIESKRDVYPQSQFHNLIALPHFSPHLRSRPRNLFF